MVAFSLDSLTTSWKEVGLKYLPTNYFVIEVKFYDTLVMIRSGGMFTRLAIPRCVPTLRKLSLILNNPIWTN